MYAARGNIVDRNGTVIAGTEMTFALELYKTKVETEVLNETILRTINLLEQNEDSYIDSFPILVNPVRYEFSSDTLKESWLQKYNLEKDTRAEEALDYFKDKYEIQNDNLSEARKIIAVRYRISSEGYSSTKSLTISNSISRKSALIFDEQKDKYPGIDVATNSERNYPNGKLASHILRIYRYDK